VSSWRNLRDVDLQIDPGTPLVCLVGENGSGKSAMLELLSAAAHHLGISQGLEIPRGNPFDEDHDFRVVVEVPTASVQLPEHAMTQLATLGESWSGQLVLTSRRENGQLYGPVIVASGLSSPYDRQFAQEVVNALRQRQETQHLYLDADRSYPPVQIEPHR
jgi:ABC-type dipeptide/oligopeptide/nickel transport system ATPase component